MSRPIDVEKAVEIIEAKQKELCPVGRYGRNYVYGSDREKYDAWEEIIDALENLPTLTPPNESLTQPDLDSMDYDKVWIDYEDGTGEWALVCRGYIYSIDTLEGTGFDFVDYMRGERLEPHGYKVYRRPPERQEAGQ